MTLQPFDVRRTLLNMNTQKSEVFGVLTVRLFINRRANRWQIDVPGLRTSFSYKTYPASDYVFGVIDQIGERNAALARATAYIMAHYRDEQEQAA